MKDYKIGRVSSKHGLDEKCVQNSKSDHMKKTDHFTDVGSDRRTTLKYI